MIFNIQKRVKYSLLLILVSTLLSACVTTSGPSSGKTPIDQVPEYGGLDRNSIPELREGDRVFIDGVTKEFGSRKKASAAFSAIGMKKYREDDLRTAMQRLNQAWLLDKDNFEAYWGFSSVISDKGNHIEALKWLRKAYTKKSDNIEMNSDLAFMYSAAGISTSISGQTKIEYFNKSLKLFTDFEKQNTNNPYIYYMWSRALATQEKYKESLSKLQAYKSQGGLQNVADFERQLRLRIK